MEQSSKILLVSADEALSSAISTCLALAGYKVKHTPRGVSAIELLRSERPALVILDILLPDFNSLAIVRMIRSDGPGDDMPVVLVGSNLKEEEALLGLEAGADLCLLETFHPQVFVARVRSLMRRHELVKVRK